MRVAVIGGGIAGLAAAYDLQNRHEVTLFEASPRLGGKIGTVHEGEFLIEQGPESVFSAKPWALDLMRELGLESELIEPLGSEFSILLGGKLYPVPRPLASFALTPEALERASFLTPRERAEALWEKELAPGGGQDESIGSFFRRRFGPAFSKAVAEPLLAGTHAGDPDKLSMAALYPGYLAAERDHGSVSKVALERSRGARVGFVTLRGGMERLSATLASRLIDVRVSTSVVSLARGSSGLTVVTGGGEELFDHVVLTVPAFAASPLLAQIAAEAAELLASIRFVSTAIVTLAYGPDVFEIPPQGNGFLVPFGEPSTITGCTWTSNKWPDRAPEGSSLLRVFLGRDSGARIDDFTDDTLRATSEAALRPILAPRQAPLFSRVDRWSRGLPQYELGHLDKLAAIEAALAHLPITLAGCSYRGNSISDCVRQARTLAAAT